MIFSVLCVLLGFSCAAQDLNLTQYYASPLWLNPAFTGAIAQYRFTTTYRHQWVQVPGAFRTNLASFDYNLLNYHSGLGVLLYSDRIPAVNMQKTHISASYAYGFFTGTDWQIRLGLQFGYTQLRRSIAGLMFGDELLDGSPTAEAPGGLNKGLLDVSGGLVLYNRNTWLGVALYHLHRPVGTPQMLGLPLRLSAHFGTTFKIKGRNLLPAILYQKQAGFNQIDLGANYMLNPLVVGIWYRGIPIGKRNQDALALYLGINYRNFTIGYSYDYNITPLRGKPGGSHEFSLMYVPPASRKFKRKYKGKQYIQCPTFKIR